MRGINRVVSASLALIAVVSMTACGGGGGGSSSPVTPVPGAAVSKGVITALGSVVVNGITYNIDNASVKIDDNPSASDQLKVGMVVKVRGSSDDTSKTGTATLIEARDALEGTISAVGTNTITVMGQTVRIEDNLTRLNDDNTLKTFAAANFQPGDRVEIHGFADDQGGLRATRVAKKTSGEFEIKGFVASTGTGTFALSLTPGGPTVLTVTGALPAGAIVGSVVEVKSNSTPAAGAITATSVTLEDRIGEAGEKVEVEGMVTSGNVDSFIVNGQQVLTSSSTIFEGGLKTDFAVGVKVEAEGPLNSAGAIAATKISFRSNIKIEADASAVTATGLTVIGKSVAINTFTRIDNGPLASGQHVEVRAMLDRDGNLIATRIVVRSPSTRAILQGPVTASNSSAGTLTILGNTISTNGAQFRSSFDSSETAVTQAAFFAQIVSNVTVVKVKWDPFTTVGVSAKEVEIEVGKTLSASGDDSSKGVVTAKGSVFVNGIRFHTGGAAVLIDGVPSTEDNLKVGMVVKVRGEVDNSTQTGTATLVEANDALEGTISAVGANSITVMGQTVRIEDNVTRLNDDDTQKVFASANFAVGDRVEVHGFLDDSGGVRATRVAKKTSGEFEVKGFIVSIGSGSFGLSLTPGGAATITVTGSLPTGAAVGSAVEIKAGAAPVNGAVTATLVKLEDRIGVNGEKVEVEGVVMNGGTVDDFTINGQRIITNASTLFEGGLKADFAVGIKVEAEGFLDANGAIVAAKVTFRSNIKIEADASAVTATGLTVLGKAVAINSFTRIDNGPLANGQHVEVRALLDRDGNLIATRIVVKSSTPDPSLATLQGPVSAMDSAAGTMTILGVPVTTAGAEFRISVDSADQPVAKDAFFSQLVVNVTVVKVRWRPANALNADMAEIQLGK